MKRIVLAAVLLTACRTGGDPPKPSPAPSATSGWQLEATSRLETTDAGEGERGYATASAPELSDAGKAKPDAGAKR